MLMVLAMVGLGACDVDDGGQRTWDDRSDMPTVTAPATPPVAS
ncbi:MAG: hypothetical protein QG550_857, partial [Pseudomonadota bacterium]|nr:hypothetical protein [Pseudomonadota bacterium]